jgi:hypothetical protein
MAGFINAIELDVLNAIFSDPVWTEPTTLHIGVSSVDPTEDGSGINEPSTGGYARQPTSGADWSAADGSGKTNTAVFTFAQASADWVAGANITHFVLFDALAAGNPIAFGALGTPKPVLQDDTASFAAGSLIFTLD